MEESVSRISIIHSENSTPAQNLKSSQNSSNPYSTPSQIPKIKSQSHTSNPTISTVKIQNPTNYGKLPKEEDKMSDDQISVDTQSLAEVLAEDILGDENETKVEEFKDQDLPTSGEKDIKMEEEIVINHVSIQYDRPDLLLSEPTRIEPPAKESKLNSKEIDLVVTEEMEFDDSSTSVSDTDSEEEYFEKASGMKMVEGLAKPDVWDEESELGLTAHEPDRGRKGRATFYFTEQLTKFSVEFMNSLTYEMIYRKINALILTKSSIPPKFP